MFIPNNIDPSILTIDVRQKITSERLLSLLKQSFQILKVIREEGMGMVFENDLGLSSQDVFAGLGTDGDEAIRLREILDIAISSSENSYLLR